MSRSPSYSPGPAPKSGTTKIEAWGDDGVKVMADGVNTEGRTTHIEFQAKYDGKDYPITGSPSADTLILIGNPGTGKTSLDDSNLALQRSVPKRLKLTPADRIFWVWLRRVWCDWKSV